MKATLIYFLTALSSIACFAQEKYSDYSGNQKISFFYDNFSTNQNNWWTGDNPYAYARVEKGNYVLEWRGDLPIWNSYLDMKYNFKSEFEIEAHVKQTSQNPEHLFGVVFNRNAEGEYAFIVNRMHASVVYQDKTNTDRRFIKSGTDNSIVIDVKSNDYNKFTIRKVQNELFFFLNEKFVGSGVASDMVSSATGFQLWYKSAIMVDDIRVSYLNAMNRPPEITILNPDVSRGFLPVQKIKQLTVSGKVTDEDGILEVLVSGQEAFVDKNGNFSKTLNLAIGENKITVKATDVENQTAIKEFTINRESMVQEDPQITQDEILKPGKYHALIIGISDYNDSHFPDLDNETVNDATALSEILNNHYGFDKEQVVLLKNPTYKQIVRAFDDLGKQVSPNDNLLIFYAGHGYYDDKKGIGYWLPADAEYEYTDAWLYNSVLVDNIKKINSKHTLLISDACFSGSIFKTRSIPAISDKAYQKKYELKSRKAITSGTLKTVPNKSVFFNYLSEKLRNNTQAYLSASELFRMLEIPVGNNSPNIPQFGDIQNVGDEGGDFIFIRK